MSSQLPKDWEEIKDSTANVTFYVNHITKETRYLAPTKSDSKTESSGDVETYELPSDWEKSVDPNSGRAFYINHTTKTTQFEAPSSAVVRKHTVGGPVSGQLPNHWEPVDLRQLFIKVNLNSSSSEFQEVLSKFNKTRKQNWSTRTIERIQNPTAYRQYEIKKQSMHEKGELSLWHGTNSDVTNHINARGFDRNLSGKNATAFGHGSYFAVEASFSQQYCEQGKSGERSMYLCKVLTGEYTAGSSDMRAPPAKNPREPHITYDSVVNNVSKPTIYVVFADSQAYPEYLLTFA